jgi:hypothetical protein
LPAASTWSPPPPPEVGRDGRVRTDGGGQQPAGRRTGGHRTGWTLDALDTRRPDTGRLDGQTRTTEPLSGHHMVDADRRPTPWQASWPCRPRRQRLPAGCRLDAPPASRRLGDQPTRTAQQQGLPGRARPPPRPSAAGATPPSSWRLGALLSSDDFGSSVEREAHGQVLCRALAWLYEWTWSTAGRSSDARGRQSLVPLVCDTTAWFKPVLRSRRRFVSATELLQQLGRQPQAVGSLASQPRSWPWRWLA